MEQNTEFDFGSRLRELRKASGLSQEELSFISDVSVTYIRYLEKNRKSPTLVTIQKICRALEISLSDFFDDGKEYVAFDPKKATGFGVAQMYGSAVTPISIALGKMVATLTESQKKTLYKMAQLIFKEKD